MKISIITAVYNRALEIEQALESVHKQYHADIEHIIIDGMSSDGTSEIVSRTENPNLRILREPDEGIYDALNKGISLATGDVIGLMHSDDSFAHNDVIATIAAAFDDPGVDIVYGDLDYVKKYDNRKVVRHWVAGEFDLRALKFGWMPPHPTIFVRDHIFETHGLYNTSYRIAADYDAILKWFSADKKNIHYIPEVLVKMQVGGESNASLKKVILKSREDYRALTQNNIGGLFSLACKNISKIHQFL